MRYGQVLRDTYGGYFAIGRQFAKVIGKPAIMGRATEHLLPRRAIMAFALRAMANLSDGRDGDLQDRMLDLAIRVARRPERWLVGGGPMLIDYLPIVVMAGLAAVFAIGSLAASSLFRPNKPNPVKLSAYECGNDPVRLPRGERFSVKFYVVAMLFIIFDIETIFLFPWAVSFRRLGMFGLVEMAVFIGLVFVAYVYIWRKGGFDWAHGRSRRTRQRTSRSASARWSRTWPMPVERYEGIHLGTTPEEITEEVERGVLLTTMDRAIGWARKQSMWPATFGLACCAIEMMATGAGQYDLSRWGWSCSAPPRGRPTS